MVNAPSRPPPRRCVLEWDRGRWGVRHWGEENKKQKKADLWDFLWDVDQENLQVQRARLEHAIAVVDITYIGKLHSILLSLAYDGEHKRKA